MVAKKPKKVPDTAMAAKKPKKIYVMGGNGTYASLDFCSKFVDFCAHMRRPMKPDDFMPFTLDSQPAEHLDPSSESRTLKLCDEALQRALDRAGAHSHALGSKVLAVCACNTMHASLGSVTVPKGVDFLHIVDAAKIDLDAVVRSNNLQNSAVVLWSTIPTARLNVYSSRIPNLHVPSYIESVVVDECIDLLKSGKMERAVDLAEGLLETMPEGTVIILGCTELPLLTGELSKRKTAEHVHFVDSTMALAKQAYFACDGEADTEKAMSYVQCKMIRVDAAPADFKEHLTTDAAATSATEETFVDWSAVPAEEWFKWQQTVSPLVKEREFLNRFLPRLISESDAEVIFDLGCGNGIDCKWMAEKTGLPTIGFDYNQSCVDYGNKHYVTQDNKHRLGFQQLDILSDSMADNLRKVAGDRKVLFTCLGNTIGIIPEFEKAIANISKTMEKDERFLLVSHNDEKLESHGQYELYGPMAGWIGKVDQEASNLKEGVMKTETGYTSYWFGASKLDDLCDKQSDGTIVPFVPSTNVGMDSYGYYVKK